MPRNQDYTSAPITRKDYDRLQSLQRDFEKIIGHNLAGYVFTGALVDFCADNLPNLARHFAESIAKRVKSK